MRYLFFRGTMAGRATANIILFTVAVANGESNPSPRSHNTLGRGARLALDSWNSAGGGASHAALASPANFLDTSQWLARESSTVIQVNGVRMPIDVDYQENPRIVGSSSQSSTLVASVRTKLKKSARSTEVEEDESAVSETEEAIDPLVIQAIAKPFVPKSIWGRLRGTEFDQPGVIDSLVKTGLSMTSPRDNEWITWKSYNNNKKSEESSNDSSSDQDIRVYVGKCSRVDADDYYGANLPMIRTEAIVRHMTPRALAELLLDSSRVQVYNKMSIGRADLRAVACDKGVAKIVQNLTQPPITNKKVESTTFLHARQLNDQGAYLVVSRAVPPAAASEGLSDKDDQYGKSEILLGVNLLEPCEDDASSLKMTSVTHVYSPALPVVLAKRVGVSSAIGFVKDIRSVCCDENRPLEE